MLNQKRERKNRRIVSSKRYLNSLILEIEKSKNNIIWDDMYLYFSSNNSLIDRNISKLSYFKSYIIDLANYDDNSFDDSSTYDFPSDVVYFKYKGKYYKIETIYGQGSVTSIELCSSPTDYFDFDKYYSERVSK